MRIGSKLRSVITALLLAAPIAACTGLNTEENNSLSKFEEVKGQCGFTQGYWKTHPEAWPVESLTLGDHEYSKEELLDIFHTPPAGNGLLALAHQLIAAKLNVANGAPVGDYADEIAAADDLIDGLIIPPVGEGYLAPATTSALVNALTAFNELELSGDECEDEPECGDGTVDEGEECDDNNTTSGDGCSATCEIEKAPCCGDGHLDAGEQCDDNNTTSGDGCSATCEIEVVCVM